LENKQNKKENNRLSHHLPNHSGGIGIKNIIVKKEQFKS
jgi:hypothetical protein